MNAYFSFDCSFYRLIVQTDFWCLQTDYAHEAPLWIRTKASSSVGVQSVCYSDVATAKSCLCSELRSFFYCPGSKVRSRPSILIGLLSSFDACLPFLGLLLYSMRWLWYVQLVARVTLEGFSDLMMRDHYRQLVSNGSKVLFPKLCHARLLLKIKFVFLKYVFLFTGN